MASNVREVSVTAPMGDGEAQSRLRLPVERARWLLGVASMPAVHAVDRRTAIPLETKERADAIHDLQDTNSPAGKTDGADVVVNIPATTYFPRGLPPEYLRRWRA